jgi:hypothetical protein
MLEGSGSRIILAQIKIIERPNSNFHREIVHPVQCSGQWSVDCLNNDCWALQNINGYYCCEKWLSTKSAFNKKRGLVFVG